MDINNPSQDDPDKIEKPIDQNTDDEEQPFTNQTKTGSAREIPDENVLKEIWQSVGEEYPSPAKEATSPGGIGGFIKKVTDKLLAPKPAYLPPQETPVIEPPIPQPNITTNPPAEQEKKTAPAAKLYPFDTSDQRTPNETAPLTRNDLRNLTTKKLQESRRTGELKINSTTNRVDDEIARRIKAIRSESTNRLPEPVNDAPAFVVDDDDDFTQKLDTLAAKVKRGALPPETIKLLITSTMDESEVILVSRDLGIEWSQIPVTTREAKIQFLIDYFGNKKYQEQPTIGQEQSKLASKPAFHPGIEQDWLESDSRLQALQDSLVLPENEVEKPKATFLEHLKEEFDQSTTLIRVLMVSLTALAVILVAVIVFFLLSVRSTPGVQPSPTYAQFPSPMALQFPGGWIINLKTGSVKDGKWQPTQAEWLDTTEVCRMISLPWSKQLDAIFLTFEPGDKILMTMSNADLFRYKVESTKTILSSEIMDQVANCTSPSLMIVLTQDGSDERLMLVAALSNTSLNSPVTVTPGP